MAPFLIYCYKSSQSVYLATAYSQTENLYTHIYMCIFFSHNFLFAFTSPKMKLYRSDSITKIKEESDSVCFSIVSKSKLVYGISVEREHNEMVSKLEAIYLMKSFHNQKFLCLESLFHECSHFGYNPFPKCVQFF